MHIKQVTASLVCGVFLLSAAAQAQQPDSSKAEQEGIVAVVGSEVVTVRDVRRQVNLTKQRAASRAGAPVDIGANAEKQLFGRIARQLVTQKLIYTAYDNKKRYTPSENAVNKRINQIKNAAGGWQDYCRKLNQSGMTPRDMRDRIRRQLMVQRILQQQVYSQVHVRPREIRRFYQENRPYFTRPPRARVQIITLKKEGTQSWKKLQKTTDKIYAELDKGTAFAELAADYSDNQQTAKNSGNLGWFWLAKPAARDKERFADLRQILPLKHADTYVCNKDFRQALRKLEAGQHTDSPVKKQNALHILRVAELEPAHRIALDDNLADGTPVRKSIRRYLRNKRVQKHKSDLLDKLRRDHLVYLDPEIFKRKKVMPNQTDG